MNSELLQKYKEMGFSKSQLDEIDAGLNQGLDVSVYAKNNLLSPQMYQLRLALERGIDLGLYADGSFDAFQIEEIRLGAELGLSVEKYAINTIPSEKMRQLRLGLEGGMDFTDFLKYDARVICELREALAKHIDIINYVEAGYDAGQLHEIRYAIENGVDVFQYLKPEFRAVSLHEIIEGLIEHLDVEIYAKTCYTWSQMREIRLGLESQVDVSYYSSTLYDRYQMEQIRLGLEAGLEVTEYTSLVYPASFMKKIRLELEQGSMYAISEDVPAVSAGEENKDGISITVSDDDMTAYIRINRASFGIISRKEILRSLRVLDITKNIDPRMVDNLLAGKHLDELVQIAAGKPPIDGENGYYEFFFDTSRVRSPKINEDGSVDFQNTEWYEKVKRGQKLAYYHSAGKGEEGFTVIGKRIPPKRGKEMPTLRGKGFVVSADRKTYISDSDGRVELNGNNLEVSKILMLKDVNQAVGNVHFEGNVLISGTVSNGVTIEAGGDVIISGFVENCIIKARGDVILKKGVNGGGTGSITAGGSVEGKFFESVNVKAGKSIMVNYSLHSNLYSEDRISICGGRGLIIGGDIFAANDIRVSNVGNEAGVRTKIRLGVSDEMQKEQRKIDSVLVDLNNKMLILQKGKRDFDDKFTSEIRNSMEVYKKIENAIFTLNKEMEEVKEEKDIIIRRIMATADSMMTVSGDLYENILIEIDGKRILSTKARNVTIKKVNNHIGIYKNN